MPTLFSRCNELKPFRISIVLYVDTVVQTLWRVVTFLDYHPTLLKQIIAAFYLFTKANNSSLLLIDKFGILLVGWGGNPENLPKVIQT